ncbi:hypothetical protein K443DRAFT_96706 [Laccaria amethystina LaAM-08-1]|uniref:Peroxisomal biogenesis factor 3 n=1 Tax=Laccaria amethystina LaAM-08-1 TaxID=1095629 RepID=A0A0C9XY05_9AGAR|nr:hypothetical protein K443DRAFT_96706 [Laccaria amethystina LaAM-08-1]
MLDFAKNYVYNHKKGLSTTAGFVGGLYLTKTYITERLEEVRHKIEQERSSRDCLKRRFRQTQEDVSYTVLAMLPTLAEQVLEEMDVEYLTKELQNRSKVRNSRQLQQRPPSSLASSIEVVHEHETRSEGGPAAQGGENSPSSWVESTPPSSAVSSVPRDGSPEGMGSQLSVSVTTNSSSANGEAASVDGSTLSESFISPSVVSDSGDSRTKAELWNETKILTITRTLTALYSTTLLCLFITIQLTLLARSKYIHSVLQQEHDERLREQLASEFTMSNILLGGSKGLEDLISGVKVREEEGDECNISEELENKYLTLSWWLLHVGWKDVGERVRRGVEEVFDGVSLKTKLSLMDLHHLIRDVRRRIEHEITFEGNERRTTFLSALLPSTPETTHHVLIQGGFPLHASYASSTSSQITHHFTASPAFVPSNTTTHPSDFLPPTHIRDPGFTTLIEETRGIISSADFASVLETCLDRATQVLFSGLEKNVFIDTATAEDRTTPEEVRIRLAGLLPGLARWSSLALNGLPNELVDTLLDASQVAALSAILFARFDERFR